MFNKALSGFLCLFMIASVAAEVDPTRPLSGNYQLSSNSQHKGELRLQSIVTSAEQRKAVISGQSVKVGDTIGKYQVKQIVKNKVVLFSSERVIELELFGSSVKISNE